MLSESHAPDNQPIESFLKILLETLRALLDVHAELDCFNEAVAGDKRCDAQVKLQIGGKSLTLLIEAKKTVYPRDVREALWQLREFSRRLMAEEVGEEVLPFLVAEAISPGAKELLHQERVGYFDSGGSLFFPVQGAYLYIEKPAPKSLSKTIGSLFSERRAQVLHALLIHPRDWTGVKKLAEQAQVSPATASQVLTELERFEWVASRGQGPGKERHLKEPAALLDAWAKQLALLRPPVLRRYYLPAMKAENLLDQVGAVLAAHGVEYAVSYEAAAQRYAPFLTNISKMRCRLLPGQAINDALSELGAREVGEGANFMILDAKSPRELLFRAQVDGIWLASPIQVYLDLLQGEGRSKEMAEHLRKERIGF